MGKLNNEVGRVEALKSYQVLDTAPENKFDEIVHLAKYICDVPIALVSLVDESRQWFKAKVGLDACETPRDISFCTFAIEGSDLFEIKNASEDKRFAENPLVLGEPFIKFYAGYPLETKDGYNLGTLCVIDREPRAVTSEQKAALKLLAHQVVSLLELAKANFEIKKTNKIIEVQNGLISESQKLAAVNKAAAQVAHEINNPLAIIQANVDILKSIEYEAGTIDVKEKLSVVDNSISRIKNIVAQMKTLA